jgi:hypothetical protein
VAGLGVREHVDVEFDVVCGNPLGYRQGIGR